MTPNTLQQETARRAEEDASLAAAVLSTIAETYDNPAWLMAQRRDALDTFRAASLPDQVTHLWRYTDPASFQSPKGFAAPVPPAPETAREFPALLQDALRSESVAGAASGHGGLTDKIAVDDELAAAGVKLMDLHEAARTHPELVREHLGSTVPPAFGKFEALINAVWTGGLLIHVPRGVHVTRPIHLMTRAANDGGQSIQRLLVIVEENASLTLIDEYGEGDGSRRTAQAKTIVEMVLRASARVKYAAIQNWGANMTSYLTHRARLDSDAQFDMILTSLGSATAKIDCGAVLAGRGAESHTYGLAIGTGRQHFDHHTVHHHEAGSTQSDLKFKVALRDAANSVYTGLIGIDANAPYCEAYQENRNLLLSPNAKAETIPELEILTNEVRCSHGATVGKINPDEIFYLESRGIKRQDAIHLIVTGFVQPILQHVPNVTRNRLESLVLERLNKLEN